MVLKVSGHNISPVFQCKATLRNGLFRSNEQADEAKIHAFLKAVSKQWQRIFRKFEGGVMKKIDLNAYVYDFANAIEQAAKAQAVPEKDAVIKKLSDQLYAQEMKASAARVLCETACELLDDYAHQDAMVILNDLEQAMKEPAND